MFKTLFLMLSFLTIELTVPFTATPLLANNYSQVTAHRGSSAVTPENTLGSFRQAIIDRAGIAELDVQETADGIVMVMHDDNVLRTTGINKNMWEVTSSELMEVSAGSWVSPKFQKEHVPTLEEVIGLAKGHLKLNIELKNNGHVKLLAEKTVELIQINDFEKECIVTSFDAKLLHTVKKLNPQIKTGLIIGQKAGNIDFIMESSDYDVISAAYPLVNESFVRLAEAHQKEVYA